MPAACPNCAGPYLEQTGFGTERVEAEVKKAHPGARVARQNRGPTVPVSDALLGRVVDAFGRPMDGGPPIQARKSRSVQGSPPSPFERRPIETRLATGVRVLDGLLPLGLGQSNADAPAEIRILPGQITGFAHFADRLGEFASGAEGKGEAKLGLGEVGLQPQGCAGCDDRIVEFPLEAHGVAKVAVGEGEIGLEPQGRAVLCGCFRRLALKNLLAVIEHDDAVDDAHQDAHDVLDPDDGDADTATDVTQELGGALHLRSHVS